ncbi:MAG: HAMP domain-containing protein [Planctomycetota bacterium]
MSDKRTRSLGSFIGVYSVLILVAGMAGYGVFQYFMFPGKSVVGLIAEHLSHLFVLIVLMYGILYLFLLRKVVDPIRKLRWKFYSLSEGDFKPIEIDSNILEVQEIARGLNQMVERINISVPTVSLKDLTHDAEYLRKMAQNHAKLDPEARKIMLKTARDMDDSIKVITRCILDCGHG